MNFSASAPAQSVAPGVVDGAPSWLDRVYRVDFDWSSLIAPIGIGFVLIGSLFLAWRYFSSLRKKGARACEQIQTSPIDRARERLSHLQARIGRLDRAGLLSAARAAREAHSDLSMTLRAYIEDRTLYRATERTRSEIELAGLEAIPIGAERFARLIDLLALTERGAFDERMDFDRLDFSRTIFVARELLESIEFYLRGPDGADG